MDLLAWGAALATIMTGVVPALWKLIFEIREQEKERLKLKADHDRELEELRLDVAKLRQALFGVNADNGLKGRLEEISDDRHDLKNFAHLVAMKLDLLYTRKQR